MAVCFPFRKQVSPPLVSGSRRVIHEANSVNNHKRAMLQDLTT
jgi:hypothetical protein